MKLKTFAFAFGPAILLFGVAAVANPMWLKDFGVPAVIAMGAVIGGVGAIANHMLEPRD